MLGIACLDRPAGKPDRGAAAGARAISLQAPDGVTLNARLWMRDPRRVVIYLHEYGDDQTSWWPTAEEGAATDPSAITFDFRGHGASAGEHRDIANTPGDVQAALAFASAQGFQRVMFVGAGMGAAAAMEVAADNSTIGMVALSAPADFADLHPVEVVQKLGTRIAFIAGDGDISAHDSLNQFRIRVAIPASHVVILKGTEHGQDLLTGTRAREAKAALQRLTKELWQP